MKRTKLAARQLPAYTQGEEITKMITHIVGAVVGLAALVACVLRAAFRDNGVGVAACAIYGAACVAMFTISSVYHGLRRCLGKKVMQVVDHCTIYYLIAGTYTPVLLSALRPVYPDLAWGLFFLEWGLALAATVLTAIDLKKYSVFSMCCYIGMGWAILPFWRQTMLVMGKNGFSLLLAGGIAYTIGSVLYGLGSRRRWMHSVFHVFVVCGAAFQAISVLRYAL